MATKKKSRPYKAREVVEVTTGKPATNPGEAADRHNAEFIKSSLTGFARLGHGIRAAMSVEEQLTTAVNQKRAARLHKKAREVSGSSEFEPEV
jgi:hypothetical protein